MLSALCVHERSSGSRLPLTPTVVLTVTVPYRAEPGWFNSGYIFPEGFTSRVNFRSSVVLDALCVHECSILGAEGQYWPAATFRVTAMDRANEPFYAKSCTGCWSQVSLIKART